MNTHSHICGLGSFIPERILTNQDLEGMLDTSDEWITSRTGIRTRHILDDDANASDAGAAAAAAANTRRRTGSQRYHPYFRSHLHAGFPLSQRGLPYCGQAGAVFRAGAPVWRGPCVLISTERVRVFCTVWSWPAPLWPCHPDAVVLLVGAEALSRRMNFGDRSTCVLFGDGAGAVVLRGDGKGLWGVRDVSCCSDGSFHKLITVGGGTSMRVKPGEPYPTSSSFPCRVVKSSAMRCVA